MALGSTQPLTEMSTRSIAVVMKSGNLNLRQPFGPLQACNGTAFTIPSGTFFVKFKILRHRINLDNILKISPYFVWNKFPLHYIVKPDSAFRDMLTSFLIRLFWSALLYMAKWRDLKLWINSYSTQSDHWDLQRLRVNSEANSDKFLCCVSEEFLLSSAGKESTAREEVAGIRRAEKCSRLKMSQ